MAQDTKPASTEDPTDSDDDGNFHYYSGGEIKELAGTRVSPALWLFYLVLVVILLFVAVSYFTGNRSTIGLGRPAGLAPVQQTAMQTNLDNKSAQQGFEAQDQLDISRIPLPAGENLEQAIDKGADVYQANCFGCHGPNQDGNGVNAASLNPKPRNLRDAPFMQAMSYQRINTSVHKGVPGTAMPRWENVLTEDQIKNVIAYVLSLTAPTAPAAMTQTTPGGTSQYTGQSEQNSPAPITPPINGNPAAETNTAPPSASGQPTGSAERTMDQGASATHKPAANTGLPNTAVIGKSSLRTDIKNTGSGAEAIKHNANPASPAVAPNGGGSPAQ